MSRDFGIIVLVLMIILLFQVDAALSAQLKTETSLYSVTIISAKDTPIYKKTFTLYVLNKRSKSEKKISFANTTVEILGLYPLKTGQLVVYGELGSGGDIITIMDMESGEIVDTIWGWYASISPDWTKLVYNFRYQPSAPPLYRTSTLLMYDFTENPIENSMTEYQNNPMERGFILWPEENRSQHRYFIPATTFEEQRHIISPIVWDTNSTKVCFLLHSGDLEARERPSSLVVVDISQGLLKPAITVQEIDPTPLYKARVLERKPEQDRNKMIPAAELRFVKNDQAVAIKAYESSFFDGQKTVIVDIQN